MFWLRGDYGCIHIASRTPWKLKRGVAPYSLGALVATKVLDTICLAATDMYTEPVLSRNQYRCASHWVAGIVSSKSIHIRREPWGYVSPADTGAGVRVCQTVGQSLNQRKKANPSSVQPYG